MGPEAGSYDVTAVLDPRPRYKGTSHEDATARSMGFRAALLPGVFVYGHAVRPAVQAWGLEWLKRGWARVRFRRPVYSGDPLRVDHGEAEVGDSAITVSVRVTNCDTGEVVLDGAFGLATQPLVAPRNLEIIRTFHPKRAIHPGAAVEGWHLGTEETVLDRRLIEESLEDFHETEPIYARQGLIHSGCLIRKTMGDALGNLILPMPVIFAGVEVQHFAPAPMDALYMTSSHVTRGWEVRGKHFFETEEWLIADGTPVARHIRQNLYAMTSANEQGETQ